MHLWCFKKLYLGIFLWRVKAESQMSKTSTTDANNETASEPAICRQYLSKTLQTFCHGTCLFPFNPTYPTAPAVPVAEATTPNISCVITTSIVHIWSVTLIMYFLKNNKNKNRLPLVVTNYRIRSLKLRAYHIPECKMEYELAWECWLHDDGDWC